MRHSYSVVSILCNYQYMALAILTCDLQFQWAVNMFSDRLLSI